MKLALSTIAGVESVAKKEIEKQGGVIEETIDKLITFSGGIELIPRINLWSRVGNKLYILLAEKEKVQDFDSLFDLINSISWKKYFKKNFPVLVKGVSVRSELSSTPTIQSIAKKAIVKSILAKTPPYPPHGGRENISFNQQDEYYFEDKNLPSIEILVLLIDNKARILLNTSGEALHIRGYRKEAGEAPLKESLAAALVLLSGWKFKEPFFDPFCGSGTIAIEAFMIAKNIAPGLQRKFAFENWGIVPTEMVENERILAKKKEYSGKYQIFASDIDEDIIKIAKINAKRAGLEGKIEFRVGDFRNVFELCHSELVSESLNNSHPNPLSTERGNRKNPPQLRGKADEVSKGELESGNIIKDAESNDYGHFKDSASSAEGRNNFGTLVSNPPYGNRLNPDNLKEIYIEIDRLFRRNLGLNGGIISSFMEFDRIAKKDFYKKRKLYNGSEMCYFWKRV